MIKIHVPLGFRPPYNMVVMLMIRIFLIVFVIAIASALVVAQAPDLAALNDPVSVLVKNIERGDVKLEYRNDGWGYLRSLLEHLDIHIDSQILVFSKTSFQLTK